MEAPETWESRPGTGTNRTAYTPLNLVQDLACRVTECFCLFSHWVSGLSRIKSSDSSSEEGGEQYDQLGQGARGHPYNRGTHRRYPLSADSLIHVQHPGYIVFGSVNSFRVINSVSSESSSGGSLGISTVMSFGTCPVIPELVFARFELDHFADIPSLELTENWQSLLDEIQNAASQDNDVMEDSQSSAISEETPPRGLSRSVSPSSRVDELFICVPQRYYSHSPSPAITQQF